MIQTYCIVCDKYRKYKNPKILYFLKETLGLSIVPSKCGDKYKKYLKRKSKLEY